MSHFRHAFSALLGIIALAVITPAAARGNDHHNETIVTCSSKEHRRSRCDTPFRGRAVLVENLSGTDCIEGRNWGSGDGFVWVDGGCRGRFAPALRGHRGPGPRPDDRDIRRGHEDHGRGNPRYRVTCASNEREQRRCNWDRRQGRPYVERQLSGTACKEGRSWGWRGDHIWVDHGCRALFGAQ